MGANIAIKIKSQTINIYAKLIAKSKKLFIEKWFFCRSKSHHLKDVGCL